MIRKVELAALALGAVLAGLSAVYIDSGMQFLLSEVFILFLMAQMWNLLAGYAGQVSFGQQLFVGLGAYALCLIANNSGIPVWGVIVIVPLLVGVLAIPLGMIVFHLKHAYFAIGMWVAAEVVFQFVVKTEALGGSGGIVLRPGGEMMQGFPEQTVLPVALFLSVALIVGLRVFLRSRLGLATLAVRDNEAAAEASGVDIWRLHMILFTFTAAGTALAAALYYTTTLFVTPLDAFQAKWVVVMMFIVVIGGLGTLTGPALGVVLFVGMREIMSAAGYSGSQNWIVMGLLSIGVLLFLPRGLWPALSAYFQTLRGKTSS